ncbi:D-alanyl-D-alanine dipeptidase [Desulfotomaculum arcticum]|uniref:D-alanyl-D-alanine dipeptidase n=1 Tax=Desulfotruncus arcticus DSM 17038 TaxID=1121424 RepID=A0A1I2RGH1_9FIRM|nr:D-alanyl-D-alanine dipeptidase [Desulfotomaculum arcticum] [Desulfotruncus arcticus DSM 17038]
MFMKPSKRILAFIVLLVITGFFIADYTKAPEKKRLQPVEASIPDRFVYLDEIIPDAEYDIRYAGDNNFVGRPIDGYLAPKAIATDQVAMALRNVQEELKQQGLGIKVYDAYRPQRAVDDLVQWARDANDTKMKAEYYPNIDKSELFNQGYLAYKSGHSRGSTVDVSIVNLKTKNEIDMGGQFDLLDPISQHDSPLITEEQRQNRNFLRSVMEKHGFIAYYKEWWHYTINNEPYPGEYFDFPIL